MSSNDLGRQYSDALTEFLRGGGEAALERAYAIGRELIDQGRGVVDLAALHEMAIDRALPSASSAVGCAPAAIEATRFLAEGLAPYEMTLRGYIELNRTLEQRVVERTQQLEQARAMFHQSQKMETVGRLAGGVAHDFNNFLSVIGLNAEFALQDLPDGHPVKPLVHEIVEAASRASGLTRQLLAFSRKQVLAPTGLVPNEVVAGLERLLRRLVGETIDLSTMLRDDVDDILADRGQLEQVLMNLVVNARDAAATHITIETGMRDAQVMISVIDDGGGVAPEHIDHIFEPFFTTKPEGRGTGLGLATCYGIIKQSGGEIEVASAPGKGSRFSLLLPSLGGGRAEPVRAPQSHGMEGGKVGGGVILVVEDDDAVRRVTERALRRAGYEVHSAGNGAAALEILRAVPEIDLLYTDVAMPGMGGRELAERASQLRPSIRVLYTSGYTEDEILRLGVARSGVDFLQKPVPPTLLLSKVRELLDR